MKSSHSMTSLLLLSMLIADSSRFSVAAPAMSQKLLIILLDGFRWDYAQKANLINFQRLQVLGARAGYVINDFPTISFPNYYSLMTGLHTESHGMTGNFMYDASRNEYFLIGNNPETSHSHWWDGGEPVWITAVRQNKKAYMYYWPGCEVTIHKTTPTFCDAYKTVTTLGDFRNALKAATNQLSDSGTADLAVIYHEQPDYVGHKFGPDSAVLIDTLREIDVELGILLDELESIKDKHQVNLIVMSDHGMTSIDPSRTINISDVLKTDPDLFVTIMEAGALATIYTADEEKADQVYNLLKDFSPKMQVYKKEDVPERYYYKHGKYVADVICIADLGWYITQPLSPKFGQKDGKNMQGTHGYDNTEEDMRGIFYAHGPYFKPGVEVTFIRAVDPYNIMCDILGIMPAPNNGTREQLLPMLATSTGSHCVATLSLLTAVTCSMIILSKFTILNILML